MVRAETLKKLENKPPTMAVSTPIAAGKPLAFAMPKLRGKAIKNTRNPETISDFQFCLRPAKPSAGAAFFEETFIKKEKI
jgi:hypothetical protein